LGAINPYNHPIIIESAISYSYSDCVICLDWVMEKKSEVLAAIKIPPLVPSAGRKAKLLSKSGPKVFLTVEVVIISILVS
jgi:hypothetical protein